MSIYRVRMDPPDRDEYGDFADDFDEHRLELVGCRVAPRASDPSQPATHETHDHGRDGIIGGLALYSRSTRLDVRSGDSIEIDGELWSVEGEPTVWGYAGTVVALRRGKG